MPDTLREKVAKTMTRRKVPQTKYSDKLPRVTLRNKHRCQCLLYDGTRCRKMAYYEVYLWDDPEWHSRWLCVYVCSDHAEDDERKKALYNALNNTSKRGGT